MNEHKAQLRRPREPRRASPLTVLLAEDDDVVREQLSLGLVENGYFVIAVEDGLELRDYVELATQPRGLARLADVVVADEYLPGLGQAEALALLKSRLDVACVMLVDKRDAPPNGAIETLVKPVALDALCEVLARVGAARRST